MCCSIASDQPLPAKDSRGSYSTSLAIDSLSNAASKKDAWRGTEGRLFYAYCNDDRNTQAVDNRQVSQRRRLAVGRVSVRQLDQPAPKSLGDRQLNRLSEKRHARHLLFYSMLPSGRIFARCPFYNLMNIQTQRDKTFGFSGRASGDENDLGKLVDITLSQTFTEGLVVRFYYAHAFGDDVIKRFFHGQQDANTFWVDLTFTF